jgi:hypothetical protein
VERSKVGQKNVEEFTEFTADGSQPASNKREIDFSWPYEAAHCIALLPLWRRRIREVWENKEKKYQYPTVFSTVHSDPQLKRTSAH